MIDGDSPYGVRLQERVEKEIQSMTMKVPELRPVILVKIYFYFAANSFRTKRGTSASCAETKSEGEKVVICMQDKELLEKPCTGSCSINFFAFYEWA